MFAGGFLPFQPAVLRVESRQLHQSIRDPTHVLWLKELFNPEKKLFNPDDFTTRELLWLKELFDP